MVRAMGERGGSEPHKGKIIDFISAPQHCFEEGKHID